MQTRAAGRSRTGAPAPMLLRDRWHAVDRLWFAVRDS